MRYKVRSGPVGYLSVQTHRRVSVRVVRIRVRPGWLPERADEP